MDQQQRRQMIDEISKRLVDDGKPVEAGWVVMESIILSPDTPIPMVEQYRRTFFLGAQHLFATMYAILDSDREPTEKDMERMDKIHAELEAFKKTLPADMQR